MPGKTYLLSLEKTSLRKRGTRPTIGAHTTTSSGHYYTNRKIASSSAIARRTQLRLSKIVQMTMTTPTATLALRTIEQPIRQ